MGKFRSILNGIKRLGDLDDPRTIALVNDPFNYNAPFAGEELTNVRNHVWVQIAVTIMMRCTIRAEYTLYNNGMIAKTPFDSLFDNNGGNTPARTLFLKTAMWWWWEGEFFWYWEKGFRAPDQIYVLDPRKVYHGLVDKEIRYFYSQDDGTKIHLTDDNSLHIMMPNIYNPHRGVFPLFSSGTPLLKQDHLITAGNLDALKNGSIPDIVLKTKLRITEQQAKEAVERWENTYGRANGGKRVAMLGNDTQVQPISQDLIKYIDLLDWNRTTILAAYGIPLKVANAETGKTALSGKDSNEQYRALFSQTVIPVLDYWAGEINRQFFSHMGYPEVSGNFCLDKVAELQEDENELSKRENEDIKTGKVTINEVRAKHGLKPVAWGDTWWAASSLADIGRAE
jgi:HK97 family phage portal protein